MNPVRNSVQILGKSGIFNGVKAWVHDEPPCLSEQSGGQAK